MSKITKQGLIGEDEAQKQVWLEESTRRWVEDLDERITAEFIMERWIVSRWEIPPDVDNMYSRADNRIAQYRIEKEWVKLLERLAKRVKKEFSNRGFDVSIGWGNGENSWRWVQVIIE